MLLYQIQCEERWSRHPSSSRSRVSSVLSSMALTAARSSKDVGETLAKLWRAAQQRRALPRCGVLCEMRLMCAHANVGPMVGGWLM